MVTVSFCSFVQRKPTVISRFLWSLGQGITAPLVRVVKGVGHVVLDVREQVRVPEGDVRRLMAHALGDCNRREAHVDEEAHMAVPDVVNANLLHARSRADTLHLMRDAAFRDREQAVVASDLLVSLQVVLDLLGQELRHRDGAYGFRGLRVGDHVTPPQALIRTVYPKGLLIRVEIERRRGQRKQFSLPDPGPIEDLEHKERLGLVHGFVGESEVLVFRPELHLLGLLGPHLHGLDRGVGVQPVVAACVVQDGGELVVDRSQVRRRVGLAVLVRLHELVLPADDVDAMDVGELHLPEGWEGLVLDDVLLVDPGVFAKAARASSS